MSMCVQLRLTGIPVLVVGGGQSAYRKCCQLTQEGADIRVIAKRFDPCFADAVFPCIMDEYRPQLLQGMMLVIACCDHATTNAQICADARAAGIFAMSVQRDTQASMHALAVQETGEYVLAAGTKGASPLLAKKMLQDMENVVKEQYADRLVMLRKLRAYALEYVPQEARRELMHGLADLSKQDLCILEQVLQGKTLLLLCFHGVKHLALQEVEPFCASIEQRYPGVVTAIAFLSAAVSKQSVQQSVSAWMHILKAFKVQPILIPMLFQQGRYFEQLYSWRTSAFNVKPIMFQSKTEVAQCLRHVRYDSGCSCLLVIYHSCVNGAFEALLEAITEEDTKMYAVHEKQSSVCPLPFQATSVAVLPLYMLRGIHFQKDSEENSDLILRLQKQQCRVEVVTKACIELEPFQKLMIEKMME